VAYDTLLRSVLRNAGLGSYQDIGCNGSNVNFVLGKPGGKSFHFWCYTPTVAGFETALNGANGAPPGEDYQVLVPSDLTDPKNVSGLATFASPVTISRAVIVFSPANVTVGSGMEVEADLAVAAGNTSGLVAVVNGDLTVDSAVGTLDGVYIFNGDFADGTGNGNLALTGSGSLVSLSSGGFPGGGAKGLIRQMSLSSLPGEVFTYQPKYLLLFRFALALPPVTWRELPPQ